MPEDTARADALRRVFDESLRGQRVKLKRHPALVTADRLKKHVEDYADLLDGADRDEIGHVIYLLEQLAEGVDRA